MRKIPDVTIRPARAEDRAELAHLRAQLWPEAPEEEHAVELAEELVTGLTGALPAANFVAEANGGVLTGFLQAGLRSHADGCDTAHAVGYVEGWYVAEEFRDLGIGKKLLAAAEEWARSLGCREMASDALIDNEHSQRVHEALGFAVIDRCVHYRKAL